MKKLTKKTTANNKVKVTNEIRSKVLKQAHKQFKLENILTSENWSKCLKNSWNIVINNIKDMSIETIYNTYYRQILIHINTKLFNNTDQAQELCNDVFIKFNEYYANKDNYDYNKGKITSLLYKIANNCIIDYFRSKQGKLTNNNINISEFADNETGKETFQIMDHSSESSNNIDNDQRNENIHIAISKLKDHQQQIIKLFFIEEKQYNEIAEIMNISISNVSVMLLRAKIKLQELLKNDYELMYSY